MVCFKTDPVPDPDRVSTIPAPPPEASEAETIPAPPATPEFDQDAAELAVERLSAYHEMWTRVRRIPSYGKGL
jgi:hypothetical protein